MSSRVVRYEPARGDDGVLRTRLRELAAQRRRFGYRRLGYLLAREGLKPHHKKLLRIYREEGLKVRRRGGRKRALGTRAPIALPQGPNQRWSLDFVSDSLACGRRFRILCVIDDFTRECLNETLFTSMAHARFVLAAWRHDYNTVRPHSKLGGRTPAEIAGQRPWGHAPVAVAIPSTNHHEGTGLYL